MMHEVRSTSTARTPAWTAADMTFFSDIKFALNIAENVTWFAVIIDQHIAPYWRLLC